MYSSLDDVGFLSRSSSRLEVLEALTEEPRSRHDLRELTGASRVTVNRILEDLEDRNWIVRENGRCAPTPRGEFIAEEYIRLLANVDVANTLDGAMGWLPTEHFDFDLAHLADADVIRTTDWEAHTATISRMIDLVEKSSHIRGTALGFSHEMVEAIRTTTVADEATFEAVLAESAFGMVREDDGLRGRFREIVATSNGELARYTGDDQLEMVFVFDDTVVICGHTGEGPPPGTLVSDDETVRSWAKTYYETARRAANTIDADMLAPPQTSPE